MIIYIQLTDFKIYFNYFLPSPLLPLSLLNFYCSLFDIPSASTLVLTTVYFSTQHFGYNLKNLSQGMSLLLAIAYEVLQWLTGSDQLLIWYHLPANLSWSDLSSTLHSMFSFTSLHISPPILYCHTFLIFNIRLLECRFLWIGTLFCSMLYLHHVLFISGWFF